LRKIISEQLEELNYVKIPFNKSTILCSLALGTLKIILRIPFWALKN
ncbi:1569_t:CDS:1, partial [Gigaspora margarita]